MICFINAFFSQSVTTTHNQSPARRLCTFLFSFYDWLHCTPYTLLYSSILFSVPYSNSSAQTPWKAPSSFIKNACLLVRYLAMDVLWEHNSWTVFTEPLPSNGHMRHNIFVQKKSVLDKKNSVAVLWLVSCVNVWKLSMSLITVPLPYSVSRRGNRVA
jgi:hypothetical protein